MEYESLGEEERVNRSTEIQCKVKVMAKQRV